MEASTLFSLANAFVLPGWFVLVFLPRFRIGRDLIAGTVMPLALGLLYLMLLVLHLGEQPEGAGFGSLAGVAALFSSDWALLIGWVHYLAFDLFIGAWEVRDSRRAGVPHVLVIPCLVFTFLTGPVGLALYLLVRGVWKKRWSAEETSALIAEPMTARSGA